MSVRAEQKPMRPSIGFRPLGLSNGTQLSLSGSGTTPGSAQYRSNRRMNSTLASPTGMTFKGGTRSPAARASSNAPASRTALQARSELEGNLASQRIPSSVRTEALGRAPPALPRFPKYMARSFPTYSSFSMRSAASRRRTRSVSTDTGAVALESRARRTSKAPTRSEPASKRYATSGNLFAATLSLFSMTLRPQESGAASRIPPNSVSPAKTKRLAPPSSSLSDKATGSTSTA